MKKEEGNLKPGMVGKLKSIFKKSQIGHYTGTISLRTCAKAAIATILACGAVGGAAYLTTYNPSKPPKKTEEQKRLSLEDLMETTEQVIIKAVYQAKFGVGETTLHFSGSGVCVYKNSDENLAFYLTCSHVIDIPKELTVIKFTQAANGQYKVDAKTEDSKTIQEEIITFALAPLGNYKLKSVEYGLFDGYNKDINSMNQSPRLIPVTTLADTLVSDEKNWIDDEDVALVKVSEAEVAARPDRFKVFTGKFADGYELKPGDRVWAIGFPMDLGKQLCSGEIRGVDNPYTNDDDTFTLMTAPINPGNSGGPIFLEKELEEVMKDGTLKSFKSYELAGLSRLVYWELLATTGMSKIENIKNFLRSEGYSYVYKR